LTWVSADAKDVLEEGSMNMHVITFCIGLLGLLVFGLGLAVSLKRGSTRTNFGYTPDPTNSLHKLVRAHGNAAEYAAMLAVLMLLLAGRAPGPLITGTCVVATAARYVHAAGMMLSPTLDRPYPLRFAGALLTYVAGLVLAVAVVLAAARGEF
jgi:uncharacterized membrane protein YecN with MAPEG domain